MLDLIIYRNAHDTQVPVFLTLPASRWDVLEAKARLSLDNLNEGFFEYEPPRDIPQLDSVFKTMGRGQNFFDELNYFTHRLAGMDDTGCILFNGALAIHGPKDMNSLINLTWHLGNIVMTEAASELSWGAFW